MFCTIKKASHEMVLICFHIIRSIGAFVSWHLKQNVAYKRTFVYIDFRPWKQRDHVALLFYII